MLYTTLNINLHAPHIQHPKNALLDKSGTDPPNYSILSNVNDYIFTIYFYKATKSVNLAAVSCSLLPAVEAHSHKIPQRFTKKLGFKYSKSVTGCLFHE